MKCLECAHKWNTNPLMRTGQSSQVCKAKIHIYIDSVLCLGKTQGSLGRRRLSGSRMLLNIAIWIVLTEKQSNSSKQISSNQISQDTQCSCFVRSKGRWKHVDAQLHRSEKRRKRRNLFFEFLRSDGVRKKNS